MYRFRVLITMAMALAPAGLVRGQVAQVAQADFLAQNTATRRSGMKYGLALTPGARAPSTHAAGIGRLRLLEKPPPRTGRARMARFTGRLTR